MREENLLYKIVAIFVIAIIIVIAQLAVSIKVSALAPKTESYISTNEVLTVIN